MCYEVECETENKVSTASTDTDHGSAAKTAKKNCIAAIDDVDLQHL